MHITEISVKRPVTVIVICLAVILLGIYSYHKLSVDFLPDIDIPKLIVKIECAGASAQDVEQNVTQRIEAVLCTLQEVHKVRSISRDGIAYINVEFNWGTDMDIAFIQVRSKLDRVQEALPEFVDRPTIMRFDPSSTPIMTLVITGDRIKNPKSQQDYQRALVELKDVASSIIKRRLEQIDGIAYVMVTGGLDREIQIQLDNKKCLAFEITFSDIETALRRFNVSTTGGSIRDGNFQYPIRIQAEFTTTDEIYKIPVKYLSNDHIVYLQDVARIIDGFKERSGFTRLNRHEVITLFLYKETGANTVQASQKVYQTLTHLFTEYPEFKILPMYDQAKFIQESIDNVLQSLLLGGIFAFIILFYFLKDFKSPIIIGISIPISIITTLIFMHFFNINFNIISLGGLALGIGMLVDNSIVVLENIYRYREMGYSYFESAIQGTKEVSLAITASTLTTISVFLPLILIKGLAGELFYDQSITITIALTCSLIVSVTVLSLLASRNQLGLPKLINWDWEHYQVVRITTTSGNWFKKTYYSIRFIIENGLYLIAFGFYQFVLKYVLIFLKISTSMFKRLLLKIMSLYEWSLQRALQNRVRILFLSLLLLGLSGLLFKILHKELMPPVDRKEFVISVELSAGSSLDRTTSQITNLENQLLNIKGIKRVLSSVGITENILDQTYQPGINKAILDIEVDENVSSFVIKKNVEQQFTDVSDMKLQFHNRQTVFEQLFQQKQDLLDIRINGTELDELAALNQKITEFMINYPDLQNVTSTLRRNTEKFVIKPDREKTVRYGIPLSGLTNFLSQQIKGSVPTQFIDFSDKIDINVANADFNNLTLSQINQWLYPVQNGSDRTFLPVKELITVGRKQSYAEILHENQIRTIIISSSVHNTNIKKAEKQVAQFINQLAIPDGYQV
ncbi:MAG: efflux RND transporter permease subunit, partial [bacterium]